MTGIADVRAAAGFAARHPALAVQCPHCRVPAGEPCVGTASRRRLPAPHPSRLAIALPCPTCRAAAGESCKLTGRYDEPPHNRPLADEPTATILPFQPRET